jgi:hypothetical protein
MRTMRIPLVAVLFGTAATALTPSQPGRPSSFGSQAAKRTVAKAIAIPLPDAVASPPPFFLEDKQGKAHEPLAPQDAWVANLDYEAFGRDVAALGKSLLQEGGQSDVEHLNKMVAWRNLCAVVGCATVWLPPNPLTVLALSTWTYSSWTMIGASTAFLSLPIRLDRGILD